MLVMEGVINPAEPEDCCKKYIVKRKKAK